MNGSGPQQGQPQPKRFKTENDGARFKTEGDGPPPGAPGSMYGNMSPNPHSNPNGPPSSYNSPVPPPSSVKQPPKSNKVNSDYILWEYCQQLYSSSLILFCGDRLAHTSQEMRPVRNQDLQTKESRELPHPPQLLSPAQIEEVTPLQPTGVTIPTMCHLSSSGKAPIGLPCKSGSGTRCHGTRTWWLNLHALFLNSSNPKAPQQLKVDLVHTMDHSRSV